MDMSMSMSSSGPFRPTNQKIALAYWCTIAGIIAVLTLVRVHDAFERRQRQNADPTTPNIHPSRPQGYLQQFIATATAVFRELSYPQPLYFTGRMSKYFTLLPLGRWLILGVYWTILLCFIWTNTILTPSSPIYGYKWEIVGFRAGWASVTQIPFIFLLSCKFNPITLLIGISYERFNWLHRWAARTIFLTVIVHWSFFFTEWSLAGYVKVELEMMSMVKYGFGAWAVIGWMILSGFGFFRQLSYEFFVAQHICAAATLLWLLYVHVPIYARYHVYMAMGFVALDWIARVFWVVWQNTHIRDRVRGGAPGYSARFESLPGDMVRIVIDDTAFTWKAGQHVYISIPRVGPLELHPFTIANACHRFQNGQRSPLTLFAKARPGFSRRLLKAATSADNHERILRIFLSGPWGSPPDIYHYESLVLVACSSGASFVVPLVQELVNRRNCVRNTSLHWIIRSEGHLSWYERELLALVEAARCVQIRLQISVHVTQWSTAAADPTAERGKSTDESIRAVDLSSALDSSSRHLSSPENGELPTTAASLTVNHGDRPSVESMIRPVVEDASGETAVVVCGGVSVTAQARTFVAALSDERAVHKGSGAQGIYLFTETYGW